MNENTKYFLGRICTIITKSINRDFKAENPGTYPQQVFEYFLGLVESIDQQGVMLKQIGSDRRTYFFMHNIIGIAEEEVLDPEKPVDAKKIDQIKEEHRQETSRVQKAMQLQTTSGKIDPEKLAEIAKEIQGQHQGPKNTPFKI